MAVEFTNSQRTAIETRGRTLLVSAAAGSGKTATLTERIIRELTDRESPADISEMLIVTFTRAAAGELRTRISTALSAALARDPGDRRLARQLIAAGNARICTIDSFYLDVVRENFQRLGLPASFRLADDSELKPLRRECMQRVTERMYASDADFPRLCDCLTTVRGDAGLADTLLGIIPRFECLPRGMNVPADDADLLDHEAEGDFFKSRAGRCALDSICDLLDDSRRMLAACVEEISGDAVYPEGYLRAFSYDLETVEALCHCADGADEDGMRRVLADYSPLRLPSFKKGTKPPRAEELAAMRTSFRKKLTGVSSRYFSMTPDEIKAAERDTARMLRALSRVLITYRDAFREEKLSRTVCEFSDIRSYAYSLLISPDGAPTETALEWRERFSEIFVDEYQDTDPVQDAIFRAIARQGNLFMVGDIKQSIYSFRGAEPSIFAGYRRSFAPITPGYPGGSPAEPTQPGAIFMSENFRCSRNIVDFTNAVSSYLFSASEDSPRDHGIGYRPEDDLIFSRSGGGDEKAEVVLIDDPADDSPVPDDPETEYICSRISKMIVGGCDPGSIAVLSRSKAFAARVAARLSRLGIPAANSVGEDLFANPEVLMFVSLLSAVDNPQRDIPLAGALHSPVFGFTLADLVRIRGGNTNISLFDSLSEYAESGADAALARHCGDTLERLAAWRSYAEAMPVDRVIRRIFDETTALMYAASDRSWSGASVDGRANLNRLYEYARRFEASAFRGLSQFVAYVNGMISEGAKIESDASAERGAVAIMTIHKSKGLEFPTVFLAGFGSTFNRREAADNICFSPDTGVTLRLAGSDGISKLDTPMRRAAVDRNLSLAAEEEIRILYVALTRARDKLIITAKAGAAGSERLLADAAARAARGGRAAVIGAPSRISWILTALADGRADGCCTVSCVNSADTVCDDKAAAKAAATPQGVTDALAILRRRLEYVYPYSHLSDVPAKLSVSALYPGALDKKSDRTEPADNGRVRIPAFMREGGAETVDTAELAAARGTATHLFLQFCDFSRLDGSAEAIDREAARMQSIGYISASDAELLRRDELLTFSKSGLFADLMHAAEVHRETRFNIMLPAAQFATDAGLVHDLGDEKLLVQGVIDLFYLDSDGRLVLCDYKTDRLSAAERRDPALAARRLTALHSAQLGYYAEAISQIMGRRPDKVIIYSLCLGDSIEVRF